MKLLKQVKLTNEQLEVITDAIQNDIYGEVTSYSGRGMFGEVCLGIITDDTARCFMALTKYLLEAEEQELLALIMGSPSQEDTLGKSGIVYFPRLTVEDDESDEA